MSKKNFAKKLVAYSMAFAVAFSTITVSPVFVKEAKAATETKVTVSKLTGTNIKDASTAEITYVKDGIKWIDTASVMTTNDAVFGKSVGGATEDLETIVDKASTTGFGATSVARGTVIDNASTTVVESAGTYTLKTAEAVTTNTKSITITNSTAAVSVNNIAYLFNGVDNIDQVLPAKNEAAGDSVVWFKLSPATKDSFNVTTTGANPQSATVTFDYYVVNYLTTVTNATGRDCNYRLGNVTNDKLGIYLGVNSSAGTLGKIVAAYNVCERTDIKDANVVKQRKNTTYANLGTNVKLSVDVNSKRTNGQLTYAWSKDTKPVACDTATLSLNDIKDSDYGYYVCEVSDGVSTKKVDLGLLPLETSHMTTAKGRVFTINTDANVLKAGKILVNGKTSLTTSIPDGDYVYIWAEENGTNTVSLSENDVLSYSNDKRTINVEKATAYTNANVICYAVPKTLYNKELATVGSDMYTAKANLDKATSVVDKHTKMNLFRDAELAFAKIGTNAKYTETFNLHLADNLNTTKQFNRSETRSVQFGDTVNFTAPEVVGENTTYTWKDMDDTTRATGKTLVIDTVDQQDLGQITLVVKSCDKEHTHKATGADPCNTGVTTTVVYNLLYKSDLKASASDVVAKEGQKDVQLKVNATATLPIDYTWTFVPVKTKADAGNNVPDYTQSAADTAVSVTGAYGTVEKDNSVVTIPTALKELTAVDPAKPVNLFFVGKDATHNADVNYYECLVTDGINEETVVIKISEVETFKVYKDQTDATNKQNEITGTVLAPTPFTLSDVKGTKTTLAPVVVAASADIEKELTYKWTKDGLTVGTDKKLEVTYPETGSETYKLLVTEGTKQVVIEYTLNTITDAAIEAAATGKAANSFAKVVKNEVVYTGNDINPVVSIKLVANLDGVAGDETYELVLGEDYEVVLTNAKNTGFMTAKYEIKFIGRFAKVDSTTPLEGNFSITRADNEVKLADVTANVGGNVKPVATDLANANMVIKYYSDKELTKEVTEAFVKANAGTYYAQAIADATTNYNDAKSNVATIVVKALGTTSSLAVTARTSTTMTVKFAKVANAAGYRIYVKNVKTNYAWKVVKETTALTYKVTGLPAGYYTAVAVRAYDANKVLAPKYASVTKRTAPGTTSKVTITTSKNAAKLTWNKVTGATHYRVYVKKAGKWTVIANTNKNTFTKTGLKRRTTYTFAVKAYNSKDKLWADKYVAKSAKTK